MFDPTGQYPKMIYSGFGPHKIVESPEEEAAVVAEFKRLSIPSFETPPAEPPAPTAPAPPVPAETAPAKKLWSKKG